MHDVVRVWFRKFVNKYTEFRDDGVKVCMYFDPDRKTTMWSTSPIPIFAIILYMLPQEPALALRLWCALCNALGLSDETTHELPKNLRDTRALILPLLLAVELDDELVAAKIRPVLSTLVDGRFFDANEKEDEQEFGYFFFLNEKFPRGTYHSIPVTHSRH